MIDCKWNRVCIQLKPNIWEAVRRSREFDIFERDVENVWRYVHGGYFRFTHSGVCKRDLESGLRNEKQFALDEVSDLVVVSIRWHAFLEDVVSIGLVREVQFVLNHECEIIGKTLEITIKVEGAPRFQSDQGRVRLRLESKHQSQHHSQHHHQTQHPQNYDLLFLCWVSLVHTWVRLLLAIKWPIRALFVLHIIIIKIIGCTSQGVLQSS